MQMSHRALLALLLLYGLLLYTLLTWSVRSGKPVLTGVCALAASPLLLLVLRLTLEKGQPGLVDLRNGSWSFQLGDPFVLMPALVVATLAWQSIPREGFFASTEWALLSLAIGMAGGIAFHMFDTANYVAANWEQALNSPTKLAHDFVAYPVLLGSLVYAGVPMCVYRGELASWMLPTFLILVVVVHGTLMGADAYRGMKGIMRPQDLHPPAGSVTNIPIR